MESISSSQFAAAVLASPGPVLVDFSAGWCPPCRLMAPILQQIATGEADRLRVVEVDVDENPVVADLYDVTSMPTLVLFVAGREVARVVGVKPRELLLQELAPHL